QLKSENKRERSASRTEINKRFSFPFACVAFAIIGVPLGVTAHRRETSIGFAMGLIVATTYFPFVIIGDTLRGNPHAHPELLVWFPTVLSIVLGALLFRRLARQCTRCSHGPARQRFGGRRNRLSLTQLRRPHFMLLRAAE